MNKRIVHDALILTAFTLVLGFILALVQGITAEPIDKANKAAAQKAYQAVFSDAKSFEKYDYDADEADKLVSDAGYKDTIDDIETALDSNKKTLGYVITVTAKDGSQGSITFSVGIKNDGTVNGYSITSISETPGLGMKAEEADFYKQFENKKVDKFDVVKATPSKDDEIEAILAKADVLVSWAGDVKEYALQQAVSGKQWKDWKIVEGRSNRKYVNETAVADTVKDAGYDPFEHRVLGITAMTKLLGKTKFEELLSGFIEKPQGKPTLVPMSDKRPAMNTAANDFKEDN